MPNPRQLRPRSALECTGSGANLGERLRALRLAEGLTQAEVGAAIGASKQAVWNWESGYVQSIELERFALLLRALRVPPDIDIFTFVSPGASFPR
jgi:transcriptional regulator with XRE-family HTH domain